MDFRVPDSFFFLQESLTVVPFLAYPDTNKPYVLYTDTRNNCIGACLIQKTDAEEKKPIYFLSHNLSQTKKRLDHYLHNAKFTIKTDHKPLKYILDSPMQIKKIQIWALSTTGYNTQVENIKGKENHCTDLLSRIQSKSAPEDEELDIDDRSLAIAAINSNEINPRDFASSHVDSPGDVIKPNIDLPEDFNMVEKQQKDEKTVSWRTESIKGLRPKLNKLITLRRKMDFCIICLSWTQRIRDFDFTFLKKWKTLSPSCTTISFDIWHWIRPITRWGWSTSSQTCTGNSTRTLKSVSRVR